MRKNLWTRIVLLMLVAVIGLAFMSGCAVDRTVIDHRAAVMSAVADKTNSGTADDLRDNALEVAWCLENERRAAQNLSDVVHWRPPTYRYPARRPEALPWVPEDDVPAIGGR